MEIRKNVQSLTEYSLLGRSGLRVSPLCLGTMTFGTEWGWGSDEKTSKALLRRYVEAGGNFVDTADGYTNGTSETMLGKFIAEARNRDELVIATKFSFSPRATDPNAGGNGRKNMMRALEGSLRRLQTDYVDLYWVHYWDGLTPVEEVMSALDDAVKQGKVRYVGLSDTPAWYLARAQTMATLRGTAPVCALQLEYSLVERNIEREHIPAAIELGMGVLPWSPLASGFLSGKYTRTQTGTGEGEGRLQVVKGTRNRVFDKFTERNWRVLDALKAVATELEKPPAQVALNWVATRPGVSSTIIGATKMAQLEDNLAALDFEIPEQFSTRLEEAGRPELFFPYTFFQRDSRAAFSGIHVEAEPRTYRPRIR